MTSNSVNPALTWKRTGKITLRAEPYLIMRFSTGYHALYGPQCARVTLGIYDTVEAAKTVCEAHNEKVRGSVTDSD
jgi:hypothetical protein